MTYEFDTDDDDPFGGPNVIGTTPGTVELECPNCLTEGVIEKHIYHEDDIVICPDCGVEVPL